MSTTSTATLTNGKGNEQALGGGGDDALHKETNVKIEKIESELGDLKEELKLAIANKNEAEITRLHGKEERLETILIMLMQDQRQKDQGGKLLSLSSRPHASSTSECPLLLIAVP
jgi:hypothetical protein